MTLMHTENMRKPCSGVFGSRAGFTLLEVLVATSILAIAVTVVLQLFSANLRSIAASEEYVSAATRAEAKMREILNDDNLSEQSYRETTSDGYNIEVSVTDALPERTENLRVKMLEIVLTVQWLKDSKQRTFTLRTMKVRKKEV